MALLQYDISIVNSDAINRALAGVERRMTQHNRFVRRTFGGPTAGAARAGPATQQRSALRGLDQIGRAARAADARTSRAKLALQKREEREAIRSIQRQARERVRIEQRAAKQAAAARRQADMAAQREFRRRTGAIVGRAGRTAASVGRGAMMVAGLGGGALAAGAIGAERSAQASAAALANQAFGTGGESRSREQIQADMMRMARTQSARSGLRKEDILGGARSFVSIAGNVGAAEQMAPFLTEVAGATDADIGDVGRTAGQIFQNLSARGIDAAEAMEQTESIMLSMAGQAKIGSIEFRDLAQNMGKLMSATSGFDGKVSDLAETMGAVAQLAIAGGASSPEEAMTAIMRFRDDLVQNQGRFQKLLEGQGVRVFADEGRTKLRAPEEIIMDMVSATGGDLTKVGDLFGIRAKKAVDPFREIFAGLGGGEAGVAAARDLLERQRQARMSRGELRESHDFRAGQSDRQFDKAMRELENAIGKDLLPEITKLAPEIAKLAPHIADAVKHVARFVNFLAENPLKGIGAIMATAVAADLARAGIGAAIKAVLLGAMAKMRFGGGAPLGGGGGRGRGGAGRGGKGGGMGVAGGLATAGVVGFGIGTMLGEQEAERFTDPMLAAAQARRDLAAGDIDDKDLLQRKARLQSSLEFLRQEEPGALATMFGGVSKLMGGKTAGEVHGESLEEVEAAVREIDAEIEARRESTEGFSAFSEVTRRVTDEVAQLGDQARATRRELSQMGGGLNRSRSPSPVTP